MRNVCALYYIGVCASFSQYILYIYTYGRLMLVHIYSVFQAETICTLINSICKYLLNIIILPRNRSSHSLFLVHRMNINTIHQNEAKCVYWCYVRNASKIRWYWVLQELQLLSIQLKKKISQLFSLTFYHICVQWSIECFRCGLCTQSKYCICIYVLKCCNCYGHPTNRSTDISTHLYTENLRVVSHVWLSMFPFHLHRLLSSIHSIQSFHF